MSISCMRFSKPPLEEPTDRQHRISASNYRTSSPQLSISSRRLLQTSSNSELKRLDSTCMVSPSTRIPLPSSYYRTLRTWQNTIGATNSELLCTPSAKHTRMTVCTTPPPFRKFSRSFLQPTQIATCVIFLLLMILAPVARPIWSMQTCCISMHW